MAAVMAPAILSSNLIAICLGLLGEFLELLCLVKNLQMQIIIVLIMQSH